MPSSSKISRRDLLKALPAAALLASCGRPSPYRRGDFPLDPRSTVGLYPAATYDVDFADVILRGLTDLRVDVRDRSVLLKPNLVEYAPGTVINTHPLVVAGAATAFLQAGARQVVVGEAPGHRRDIEYLLSVTGLADYLKDLRIRFVDLNHDDVDMIELKSHFTGLDRMALPRELLRSDFVVSMAKLKTHHWAAMTASMKNLFGVVPGAIYGWPKNILHYHGIENSILDLNATVRPRFTIVDAVVSMEGDGPIMGDPRQTGFLAMGADLVAVDATCARVMGFDPAKIGYLSQASAFLGHIDDASIDLRGENLARYRTRFTVLDQFKNLQSPGG